MKSIFPITLGCDKNTVDTERMLYRVAKEGFEICEGDAKPFAVVINTCGFIDLAKQESVAAIMDAVRARDAGHCRMVAVVGCLVERYRDELQKEVPEVDLWMGLEHVERLGPALCRAHENMEPKAGGEKPGQVKRRAGNRIITSPGHYSFLKIADGCAAACSFCAIPLIKGKYRSEPPEKLIEEAKALEAGGVRELNLVAQDTTAYGRDLDPRLELSDLVEKLLAQTEIPWIRILYAGLQGVSDRLIELVAHEERLLSYLDLPLQHVSDSILAKMNRGQGRKGVEALVDKLRARIDGLVLRTTFLVGFPGEGEKEFEELLEFVEKWRLNWVSGFAFSPEEGTAAWKMGDKPPRETAETRLAELFDLQREITGEWLQSLVGKDLTLLVDGPWPGDGEGTEGEEGVAEGGDDLCQARFSGQAIEVDGVVRLKTAAGPGEFINARITASYDYDLEAEGSGLKY